MKRVEEIIAENRRRIRQTDARAIEVGDTGRKDLSFSRNTIRVAVDVTIYTRDLGSGLYSGHPDPAHGSGRGEAGDTRGEWTVLTETTTSETFTREGANATRDALDGQTGSVSHVGIGTGPTDATRADTALVAESARHATWGTRTANATTETAEFDFANHGGSLAEVGAFDATGRLLARATVDDVDADLTLEDDLRASVTLTVTGDAPGSAVFTDEGEAGVAESLRSTAATVGVAEFAFGTGSGDFTEASTGLFLEEFRKGAARNLGTSTLSAFAVVYATEPTSQPVTLSEVGVFDSQGRLLWATTFEPFEKTDEFPFSATVGFTIE